MKLGYLLNFGEQLMKEGIICMIHGESMAFDWVDGRGRNTRSVDAPGVAVSAFMRLGSGRRRKTIKKKVLSNDVHDSRDPRQVSAS